MGERNSSGLLDALLAVAKLYHQEVTEEIVLAGLPVDPRDPKLFEPDPQRSRSLFSRAAEKAGFSSTLQKKPLRKIAQHLLPCILVLKEERACVLLEFDKDMEYANVLIPGVPEQEGWIAIEHLEEEYLGYCFLMKKNFGYRVDEQEDKAEEDGRHWFWSTLKRTKAIYADILIGSFLVNLFILILPLYMRNVFDRVIPNSALDTLWVLTYGVVAIFVLEALLKFLRSYFMEIAAKKSDVIMSSKIFEHVMDMKLSEQVGSVGAFSSDLKQYESIRNFLTSTVVTTVIDLPFSILFLLVVYWVAGDIVYIPLFTIVLIVLYAFLIKGPIRTSIRNSNQAASMKNSILLESLNAIETIKAFNYNSVMQWKLEEATGKIAQRGLKSRVLNGSIATVTAFLIRVQTVAVIVASVYMIHQGLLTTGGLLVAYILASRAVNPVGKLVMLILQFNKARSGFRAIEKVMDSAIEHPTERDFISARHLKGNIEFVNVDFAYPDAARNALNNVSFTIKPGEHVAIMGEMGSGKTTIINLLMGFYAPKDGMILVDDVEMDQYAPAELRKEIAYVPQEIILLQGTIKENIALKHPGIDSHEIVEAARLSGALRYINQNPDGFNMKIKEKGRNVSGGQRQSIGIARALIDSFTFVLFDEPTSHLDEESERIAILGISQKIKGKTAIFVTHKDAVLELVDRIILLERGEIIKDGTKQEVLAYLNKSEVHHA
ncbi:type I secretion system permease/ATPase [Sulfurimonas sp. HSL-1656]|uniref:type I secretion system permease/ATPase n=1 Tax=Thiomicrolovo subterrani TaxID=3131934 RepID=UPI0031F78D7B